VRERCLDQRPEYWRSLEDWRAATSFGDDAPEFPKGASEWLDSFSRAVPADHGASLRSPDDGLHAQPSSKLSLRPQPEDMIPGRPQFYASATTLAATPQPGRLRATWGAHQIEGNPDHPAASALGYFCPGQPLNMYDRILADPCIGRDAFVKIL